MNSKRIQILEPNFKGSSSPVKLRVDEQVFFVKLREGMSGPFALLNEWFANRLGRALGLNTQVPFWVTLPDVNECQQLHEELIQADA